MTNYVKTTNFLRKDSLPDASPEKIIRGSEFDTEFNNLVIAVASKANLISPVLTGIPTAPTASAGSATTQIATTAFVVQNAILRGMIVMWSGEVASIPIGYALCDGTSDTPDLRNRFIIGAGDDYGPGIQGGNEDAVVVAHNHTGTTNSAGIHDHGIPGYLVTAVPGTGNIDRDNEYQQWLATSGLRVENNGDHSHTLNVDNTGVTGNKANLPPYYALAFIMKT